ncbi:MAG: glycosyltransferase family 4 protein [Bryobacteraceae bacterium]|nr:glycosyltransferase family 4 protein [Bryobacteraceae bacterium]
MRILALTAGAANMYCGSCLRDNSLARELMKQGHQVLLVPMYTPTRTDDENVSSDRVFFGGISIYLQQKFPLFRYLPDWMDKLWDSNWALRLATKGSLEVDPKSLGELTVSTLKGERGFQRREIRKLVEWLKREPKFDIIALPYTLLISLAEPLKKALGVPVVCTLQGEDLFLEGLVEPYKSECLALIRSHLKHVDRFIAVSLYYAGFMSDYLGIPRDRIESVPLGIDFAGHEATAKPASDKLRVGFFARCAQEKGLHVLCEAVAKMKEPVELHVAGYLPPEKKAWFDDLHTRFGFQWHGSPDRDGKIRFLQSVDVLSVPSEYDEPKGLFLMEAMANGTPAVQPSRGAYVEILGKTRGGLLTEPDSRVDLAAKLDTLARDRTLLASLGKSAAEGVRRHYSLSAMAKRTVEAYEAALTHG